jgi:hypothetical protein
MSTDDPIINDIAKAWEAKGEQVYVYREGRGALGRFRDIKAATGGLDYSFQPPRPRGIIDDFWCVNFTKAGTDSLLGPTIGAEMLTKSQFEHLVVKRIRADLHHIIIPR